MSSPAASIPQTATAVPNVTTPTVQKGAPTSGAADTAEGFVGGVGISSCICCIIIIIVIVNVLRGLGGVASSIASNAISIGPGATNKTITNQVIIMSATNTSNQLTAAPIPTGGYTPSVLMTSLNSTAGQNMQPYTPVQNSDGSCTIQLDLQSVQPVSTVSYVTSANSPATTCLFTDGDANPVTTMTVTSAPQTVGLYTTTTITLPAGTSVQRMLLNITPAVPLYSFYAQS